MYQREGVAAYKADIGNIVAASKKLRNPHKKFKSIHVAGTNGKGSVSHMLASILQESSYKVGLYTSPHLKDFRERIKINGEMISESEVVRFVLENKVAFALDFKEKSVYLYYLGLIHEIIGQPLIAYDYYEKSIKHDGSNNLPHLAIGNIDRNRKL